MTITLNGETREFDAPRFEAVTDLLKALGLAGHPVLVELNGRALLKQELSQNEINHGDQIEIVRMVAGG
jgi:sulfur carrier protein